MSLLDALTPLPAAPISQLLHQPPPSLSSSSPRLSTLLPVRFLFPWNFDDPPLELAYDSGSSAKLILFGVVRPEEDADELPKIRVTPPIISGMLNMVGEGVGVGEAECCFMDDCLGGDGGRVEEE